MAKEVYKSYELCGGSCRMVYELRGKLGDLVRADTERLSVKWWLQMCLTLALCTDFLCSPVRQCALVALEDVKAYFTEESGQIAVSLLVYFSSCPFFHHSGYSALSRISLGWALRFSSDSFTLYAFCVGVWCHQYHSGEEGHDFELCQAECLQGGLWLCAGGREEWRLGAGWRGRSVEPVSLLSSGFGYQSLSPQDVCLILECFLFRSFLWPLVDLSVLELGDVVRSVFNMKRPGRPLYEADPEGVVAGRNRWACAFSEQAGIFDKFVMPSLHAQVFFVESVCDDPDVIAANILVSVISVIISQPVCLSLVCVCVCIHVDSGYRKKETDRVIIHHSDLYLRAFCIFILFLWEQSGSLRNTVKMSCWMGEQLRLWESWFCVLILPDTET